MFSLAPPLTLRLWLLPQDLSSTTQAPTDQLESTKISLAGLHDGKDDVRVALAADRVPHREATGTTD